MVVDLRADGREMDPEPAEKAQEARLHDGHPVRDATVDAHLKDAAHEPQSDVSHHLACAAGQFGPSLAHMGVGNGELAFSDALAEVLGNRETRDFRGGRRRQEILGPHHGPFHLHDACDRAIPEGHLCF